MTLEEIENYLNIGSTNSVCVDRRLIDDYPGFVRDVTIQPYATLKLEFNTYGYDEGGLVVFMKYDSLEGLVASVECYIEKELASWENITRSDWYPDPPSEVDYQAGGEALKKALAEGRLNLPADAKSYFVAPGYWKDVSEGKV